MAITLVSVKPENNFSYFEKMRLRNGWECVANPKSWQLQADYARAGTKSFSSYVLEVNKDNDEVTLKGENPTEKAPGTGGSCYSWSSCAASKRGKFSMDLTGTGLIFADSVKWAASGWGNGVQTVLEYKRTATTASGKCGAWCGECKPTGALIVKPDPNVTPIQDCEDLRKLHGTADWSTGKMMVYPFKGMNYPVQVTCKMGSDGKVKTLLAVEPTSNYAYFEKKRLRNGWECNANPSSWQLQANWNRGGTTSFTSYALNVDKATNEVTLVNEDPNGRAPGTGGSCFSWSSCAASKRGKFNIDISGTGLIFADSLQWVASGWGNGKQTVLEYKRTPTTASGKCGAWCGECKPGGNLVVMPPIRDCEDLRQVTGLKTAVDTTIYPFGDTAKGVKVTCKLDANGKAVTLVKVNPANNYSYNEKKRLKNGWECVANPSSWQLRADYDKAGKTSFSYYALTVDKESNEVYIAGELSAYPSDAYTSENANNLAPGTGASCYSWSSCAASKRGKFSMDLTGTGLVLADSVKWTAGGWGNGVQTVLNFVKTATKASGNCGAWCGSCKPAGKLIVQPE